MVRIFALMTSRNVTRALVIVAGFHAAVAVAGERWRGTVDYARADQAIAAVYARIDFEKDGKSTLNIAQIGVRDASLRDVRRSASQLSFNFTYQGRIAAVAATRDGDHLSGTWEVNGVARPLRFERVQADADAAWTRSWGGLYEDEDGGAVLLTPASWVLTAHDLSTRQVTTFFPRSRDALFAGPGYLDPAPETARMRLKETTSTRGIELDWQGRQRVLKPSTRIIAEPVRFASGDVALAGLVIRPASSSKPVPGVVVMPGSGRQTRFGQYGLPHHRAVTLARSGMAALIFDKRGTGESTGRYEDLKLATMTADAAAAANFLAAHTGVDRNRVGLLVHSQSGIYAPSTVRLAPHLAFVAALSTTVVNGEIQEVMRTEMQMRADGWPQGDIDDAVATQILKFHYANHRIGWDAYVAAYHRVAKRDWFPDIIGSTIDPNRHSWDFWRDGNRYDPAEEWKKVNIPVLAIWAEHDTISPVTLSAKALAGAFPGERAALLKVIIKPGLDHNLFESKTGGTLEENRVQRMSSYMDHVLDWLKERGVLP